MNKARRLGGIFFCAWLSILFATAGGCAGAQRANSGPPKATERGRATVVWISLDGFRHDYLARVRPPTLERLAHQGAFTNQERPVFPSLTFPNHVAQVTGTTVDRNGVPMNAFFDRATGQTYDFPNATALLRAEPIWITAKRQGVRVAVIDWPLSQQQSGQWESDYHPAGFDTKRTDDQRIDEVINVLKTDRGHSPPLRLVMTYCALIDHAGHRYGPDAPEIEQAVRQTDATVGRLLDATIAWFNETAGPRDELYFVVTTDHGMEPVHTLVNLERLLGAELERGARIITSGPVASIYLDQLPVEQRAARTTEIVARLRGQTFLLAWPAAEVPARLHYSDPSRIGDVVVLLAPGYAFTSRGTAATQPATAGPHGMHGYDPAACPNMLGSAIVWRYRQPMNGRDLGPVENTQWHVTVCQLLGIKRSKQSDLRAIRLP